MSLLFAFLHEVSEACLHVANLGLGTIGTHQRMPQVWFCSLTMLRFIWKEDGQIARGHEAECKVTGFLRSQREFKEERQNMTPGRWELGDLAHLLCNPESLNFLFWASSYQISKIKDFI